MTLINKLVMHGFKSFAKRTELPFSNEFNIVIGPNGSGKCLTGDAVVTLADGSLVRIDELVEMQVAKGATPMDDGVKAKGDGTEILCLDMRTLKVVPRPINYFIKRTSSKELYKIRGKSGRGITVTPSHPFFMQKNGKLHAVRADELSEGVRIAVPRSIPAEPVSKSFSELLYLIEPSDKLFIPHNEEIVQALKIAKNRSGLYWRAFAAKAGVPERVIDGLLDGQSSNFSYVVRLLLFSGLSETEIMKLIPEVKGKTASITCKMPWSNSPELARLLGYLLAEGRVTSGNQIWFTNGAEELVVDYARLMDTVFGLRTTINEYKSGCWDVLGYSHAVIVLLTKLGMTIGKTEKKTVSNLFLSHSKTSELAELLNGLICGDGYISSSSIEITTKSKQLGFSIESILSRLGIAFRSVWQVKVATNSGFSGIYRTIRIYGAANIQRFAALVNLRHKLKQERLSSLLKKKSNSNVDVLELNSLVLQTAKELRLSVKKLRKDFPKLDAYCYNQCLPTQQGLQQLIGSVFAKQATQSAALTTLKRFTYADVFWDEIVSIEKIPSREAWVYDLTVDEHHNFVANNIFVHNSNILDGLCFVLGRLSSKDLRTEKLSHLIYNGGRTRQPAAKGEVTIFFDNKKKVFPVEEEIVKLSRIIKPSGQSVYRINDKTRTRQEILDMMAMGRINPNGYNIVLQGDITRFVEMSSDERRQVIEEIAGIRVYEEKKKKALAELERVEARIREAEILLAERKTHLRELRKDRDQALKYKEMSDKITSYKATYIHLQSKSKTSRKEGFDKEISGLNKEIETIKSTIEKLRSSAGEKKKEIGSITEEVEQKAEAEQLTMHKSIEQTRVDIATANNRLNMITTELEKASARKEQLAKDLEGIDSKVTDLGAKSKDLEQDKAAILEEKGKLEAEITKLRGSGEDVAKVESALVSLDKESEQLQTEIQKVVEHKQGLLREKDMVEYQINSLDESMKKVAEIQKTNKSELQQLEEKRKLFKKTVLELNKLLSEDSTTSATIGDNKRRLYQANEEYTKLKMQFLASQERKFGNNAVKAILDQDQIKGIHGTVSQLGSVPDKYSAALEAAAGARINSIVVSDDAVAAKCIKLLKTKKLGRATFLPMNKIKEGEGRKIEADGAHGMAVELVKFDPKYKEVFSYVFGSTLVVDSIEAARKIGIGKHRMVTLDGDLAETSGAMHGGFRQKTASAFQEENLSNKLSSFEKNIAELESSLAVMEKNKADNEETIAKKREEKAELEGEIIKAEKSLHLESSDTDSSKKSKEELKAQIKKIDGELQENQETINEINKKIAEVKTRKLQLREQISALGNPAVVAELTAMDQKVSELNKQLLSIEALLNNSKVQSSDLLAQEKSRIQQIIKQISKEEESFAAEKKELAKKTASSKKQLAEMEAKASKFQAKNKSLFAKRNKLLEELQADEEKIIRKEEQINTIEVKINNITIKASEIAGELAGLKEEASQYSDAKIIEGANEEQLKADINRFERSMMQMGNVNMKALEVYEDVEKQYNELLGKKDTLAKEKEDVMAMMNEIELKKKDIFMNTFNTLNDHFKTAFSQLSTKGSEAYLMIENPENPFDAGVRVRVRIAGEKFMDIRSLSGGEKTMTALAFIFSIQEHDPASFYIFDEVDAALDKKNSEKFAQLIKQYSSKAQYIVISHNDNVINTANTLYGVSMDENGMSNVVSLKI